MVDLKSESSFKVQANSMTSSRRHHDAPVLPKCRVEQIIFDRHSDFFENWLFRVTKQRQPRQPIRCVSKCGRGETKKKTRGEEDLPSQL